MTTQLCLQLNAASMQALQQQIAQNAVEIKITSIKNAEQQFYVTKRKRKATLHWSDRGVGCGGDIDGV